MPNVTLPDGRKHEWTDTTISLERLCATAQLVGFFRGIIKGGALDDLPSTKNAAQEILARYEEAK